MSKWTQQDSDDLISLLKRLPQPWSYEVFHALALKMVTPAIEAVILRRNEERIEILLTKRVADDPDWPSLWHIPGTVMRQTDLSFDDALDRISNEEIKTSFSFIKEAGTLYIPTKRGQVVELVYCCTIDGEPPTGKYFDVNYLPNDFIDHQLAPLNKALEYFRLNL